MIGNSKRSTHCFKYVTNGIVIYGQSSYKSNQHNHLWYTTHLTVVRYLHGRLHSIYVGGFIQIKNFSEQSRFKILAWQASILFVVREFEVHYKRGSFYCEENC
jgi:hypothetical protein